MTAQMMEMMKNLMSNLQINRGQTDSSESAPRAENPLRNAGRGAVPRQLGG